ncbi:MAG: MBL fold metallo-hydrolase [Hyphomicrobiales bacterium]|nr:MBL fold metallo-hydrolase [Hyphomicrobiales bacterium]MBV9517161.1 MBL fold metallo-hydrolase [Hyphomicrobiales bacterium]
MSNKTSERFKAMRGKSPDEAGFFWSGGPLEVAERTFFQSRFSGVTGFETDDGVVLVDSGMAPLGPVLAAMLREKTTAPIHTAVFTHGHVDHAYGLEAFLVPGQPRPRIIAQKNMLARFARYELTSRFNAAINARQFGGSPERAGDGEEYDSFSRPALMPDTLYDESFAFSVGGVAFEVHHCRAETDDHSFVWCPSRKVLCSGDLVINALPNAGNPQKVQRYPWDWAAGLRRMAALEAQTLCPGHGGPVVNDPGKIRRILIETAEYLEAIVERTLAAMADGAPPHADIVHAVKLPQSSSPWLRPIYDEGEYIVRNIVRFYGGWWNGRPSELKPAPRLAVAAEIARLAGGARALLSRAQALATDGDLRLACHLADYALEANPEDGEIRKGVAALYERRADGEEGLMSENLFRSASVYAANGRPFS